MFMLQPPGGRQSDLDVNTSRSKSPCQFKRSVPTGIVIISSDGDAVSVIWNYIRQRR
jgi:hypothetical protein